MVLESRNGSFERSLVVRRFVALALWFSFLLSGIVRADEYYHRLNSLEWYADTCDEIQVVRVTKAGRETELPLVEHVESIKTNSSNVPVENAVPLPWYAGSVMKDTGSNWIVFGRKKAGTLEPVHLINLAKPMAMSADGVLQEKPEAILKLLSDRAALKTAFPPRFDPHFIETFDTKAISVSSFSPRLVDFHLGWAKRDVDIHFDTENYIGSVREPIGPHHRERFLKAGEAWDGKLESKEAIASILGLVNFPDEEVRSKLLSWGVDVITFRTYAALQVLRYWDFVREIENSNLNVVGRWKVEGEGISNVSPTTTAFAYRFKEVRNIEFELYPDQEMSMVIIDRDFKKWFARGHWTADKENLSVNMESIIGSTRGTFEPGWGDPFPFSILNEAKLDADSRVARQARIDIRKWRTNPPRIQMELKATWLRPLQETDSDLTSLSTRRKRESSYE